MISIQEKKCRNLVLELAEKYSYEDNHSNFVEKLSLELFDGLTHLHRLDDSARMILSHAAILHDIGSFISEGKHNRHTRYIIENDMVMIEYPKREHYLLSLVAQNHRKSKFHETYSLSKSDCRTVLKLSALLRVADALHFTREDVSITEIDAREDIILLTIDGALPEKLNPRLRKKSGLFHEIFGIEIALKS